MLNSRSVKGLIKRGVQTLAARLGPHTRKSDTPQLVVLMYHRILPLEDNRTLIEEPGMIVTPETFRQNLETTAEYFEFVQLSDWLEKKQKGATLPDKACAVTFDDGWLDNYEYAYPILKEMKIPATIFLVSDMIGSNKKFWPERLAQTIISITNKYAEHWSDPTLEWIRNTTTDFSFSNQLPTREQLSRIISQVKQFSDKEIHQRIDTIESKLGINPENQTPSLLNWDQVNEMISSGLIEAGSHTCHHIRLNPTTPEPVVEREITESKHQIEKHIQSSVKTFCFPNGDYSQYALKLVEKNYDGAVTTDSGWNSDKTEVCKLQRVGIHDDIASDRTSFLACIANWY